MNSHVMKRLEGQPVRYPQLVKRWAVEHDEDYLDSLDFIQSFDRYEIYPTDGIFPVGLTCIMVGQDMHHGLILDTIGQYVEPDWRNQRCVHQEVIHHVRAIAKAHGVKYWARCIHVNELTRIHKFKEVNNG